MKRKLTLIIVDDQQSAIDHALQVLQPFIDLSVKATFTDPVAALNYLKKNHVDFVLLDMDMPVVDGLSFMMQMPAEIMAVLCTAHRKYAVDAFEQDAIDYLMKPMSASRFAQTHRRMAKALKMQAVSTGNPNNDYYYFMLKGPVKYQRTKVDFAELVYIEARNGQTFFYLINDLKKENDRLLQLQELNENEGKLNFSQRDKGKYEGIACGHTLKEVMEIVEGSSFIQVHKSFILNTDYFRSQLSREIGLKGMEAIKLPSGVRKNFPEYFAFLDIQNLPSRE